MYRISWTTRFVVLSLCLLSEVTDVKLPGQKYLSWRGKLSPVSLIVAGAPTLEKLETNPNGFKYLLQSQSQVLANDLSPHEALQAERKRPGDRMEYHNRNSTTITLSYALEGSNNHNHSILPDVGITTEASNVNSSSISLGIIRNKRNQEFNPDCEFTVIRKPAVFGLRCDTCSVTDDGATIVMAAEKVRVFLIGRNLYSNLSVALTPIEGNPQDDCTHWDRVKSLRLTSINPNVAEVEIQMTYTGSKLPLYFCLREHSDRADWFHQGSDPWLKIYVHQDFLPLYMKIIIIAVLLGLSGLFSGLNLGLMALDKNELQVIMKCGSEKERRYARAIEPVRRRGNYLLCSILFSNTLVNSTISVFLEDLSDGLIAIITSTVLIVLFGEILPQAFCSRHGLAVGARTIYLTNFCMFVTFPLSYPVSRCLDWALGEEIGHAYDRERLMEFIRITKDYNNLETAEVNIISGALKIKRICINEIMTRIDDVYMLDEMAVLDFATINEIIERGYSRIPIHEAGNKKNIVAVLFAKDLALVNPDDKTLVHSMIRFYSHPRMFVMEDTTLDTVLNEFKTGKSHMAIVQRVVNDGDKDPYYEITGIVTLEDVIEEIMQMEINDETDIWTDNRRKRRRNDVQIRKDFSQFTNLGTGDSSFNVVTAQLCLAAYQYLATTVEPFSPKYLSDSVLKRLLSQKIYYKVKNEDDQKVKRLYTSGTPADYFIMILEGRVQVICGSEMLPFEGGPFMCFGRAALCQEIEQANLPVSPVTNVMTPPRRDSSARLASRRESLAKAVNVFATKKIADTQSDIELDSAVTTPLIQGSEIKEKGSNYFVPDYTVDIVTKTAYLKVTRMDYLTALKATQLERSPAAIADQQPQQTSLFMSEIGSKNFEEAEPSSQCEASTSAPDLLKGDASAT